MFELDEQKLSNFETKIEGFDELLKETFVCFYKNLEQIAKAFYSTTLPGETLNGFDKTFSFIESTWVAILSDSLKMACPKIVSLQEYAVWTTEYLEGRGDLLVDWNGFQFLFEAKSEVFNSNWDAFQNSNRFDRIVLQAQRYYDAERDYFPSKNVYLIGIIFEFIKEGDLGIAMEKVQLVNSKKKYSSNIKVENIPNFNVLIKGKERGVLIYGIVKAVN